ncbi:MAG TPA: AAA family ATPase [Methanobacteriaceae archaeon]|nr:AAA family ATPase [Methanobacteriaceae archaeon]
MILLLTGTPGTGKTTVSKLLALKLGAKLVAVNELVEEKKLYSGQDPEREYKIADIPALTHQMGLIMEEYGLNETWLIFEGHLSHYYSPADLVVVLRASPQTLTQRLNKREWKSSKVSENVEAEALDICAWESLDIHGKKAQEIDTTSIMPEDVVEVIIGMINGENVSPVGGVSFLDQMDF